MKKIYVLCLAFLLIGCEKELEVKVSEVDKSYFTCVDYDFDPDIESVLYIDHNKKIIKAPRGREWNNYSQDEQQIYGETKVDRNTVNYINFNFVTGRLGISEHTQYEEGSVMSQYNGVRTFFYKCRKTKSML